MTCGSQFATQYNAKMHFQNVHLKNMDRKINHEYFEKNEDVIGNRKLTDPAFPSDELISGIIQQENITNEI